MKSNDYHAQGISEEDRNYQGSRYAEVKRADMVMALDLGKQH